MKKIKFEDEKENFRKNKKNYLVRCPKCKLENWAPAVATGQCSWCGWEEK